MRIQWQLGSVLGLAAGIILGVAGILTLGQRRSARPAIEHRVLLPEADGALAHVLLHWTPLADRDLATPYADFLRAIDASVRVTMVIPRDLRASDRRLFEDRFTTIDPTGNLLGRIERVEVAGPITAWSKDRALVSRPDPATGRASLVIPAEPSSEWQERHNDWQSVAEVARHFPSRFRLDQAPFDFDAGDLAVARGTLVFDGNLLEKNRRRGYQSLEQLAGRLGEYLQMQVVTIGHEPGDTPRHHLSMYMTPLTQNRILVGDPLAAKAIVGDGWQPGEHSVETGQPFTADFAPTMTARFDRARSDLLARGFEVTRIVNVPLDDKTYLAYTNGVFEVRGGRRIAYVPSYDVPALDHAAHETYRHLGWEVVPIRVRSLFPFHGTIGCVVNVLERRSR